MSKSAADWFAGKSLEDIQRLELGGRMLYPDVIKRVDPKDAKKTVDIDVYLRVPSVTEAAQARVEALAWVRQLSGKDTIQTEDQAIALLGVTHWNEVDLYCLFSYAVLKREEPPQRLMLPQFLLDTIPRSTVYDVWRRVAFHSASEDVGTHQMTHEEADACVRAIAEKGNLSPLVGMSEGTQRAFLLNTVVRLATFLTPKSSLH